MITGEIKTKIDSLWNTFWTSGITNSITVLEQMTYLFFMKRLDDAQIRQESTKSIFGGQIANPTFPEGDWYNPERERSVPYRHLRWSVFKHFDAQTLFSNVRDEVFPFIKTLETGDNSTYSKYMKGATFLIPNERTLVKLVDGVSELDMEDRDSMGDVYEYILGKMAASGTNGQFRTPRQIIRMMVELMQPSLKDKICDPAMGSAGFLVEAASYVEQKYKEQLTVNVDERKHYNDSMFYGFDTDHTMLRIGAMNMMLHGVEKPNINWSDSLSDDNKDSDRYTLILANPPFKGSLDKETVSKSLSAICPSTKTELLFLALFIRSLKLGGRCASIVPDGVLFGSSKAHKSMRRELIENQQLEAVISMPSGIFKPYAGVSTAILIFTKTNAGGTDQVWFYDMQADGYSLDDKRSPIEANDIPDIIERFRHLDRERSRKRTEQSFMVPKEELAANDYDLSPNKYKEIVRERVVYEAPERILTRIEELQSQIAQSIDKYKQLLK